MGETRYRVFMSALNDVTYWEGRPLRFCEGLHYMRSNAFVEAVHRLEQRKEAALKKAAEERRAKQGEKANG